MGAPAILKIDIIADARKAQKALKDTGGAAEKTGSRFGSVAKMAAGAFAGAAIFSFAKSAVGAANESHKSTAALEQVFRSMGDTTGVAAKQAENYAGAMSKKVGVDDDAIIAAQAQLATFGKVSDATARQAGIFDRATASAADLAAAGFGTLDSNAVQLGKALQDPTKGITALARSGVTFTAAQKAQIAAMVKHNNLLGAQKVVLGAVESQVKGTAEATATSTDKMNVAWGNTQESIGNALVPVLDIVAPLLESVAGFIQENVKWLAPLAAAIGVVVAVQWAWNAAMAANPITLVVIGIALLIAGIILLVKNWDKVKAAFVWLFNWLRSNWPLLLGILTGPIGLAILWIVKNWDKVKGALAAVWSWIASAWHTIGEWLTAPFRAAWDWITTKWAALLETIRGFPGQVRSALSGLWDVITSPFRSAFNAIAGWWNSSVGSLSFHVPGWVPGVGGKGFDVPDIPTLARGGTVLRTGFAVVHEGEQFSGVGRGFGSLNLTVNVTTTGLGADAPAIQRAVVGALRGYVGRNGPLDVPVKAAS